MMLKKRPSSSSGDTGSVIGRGMTVRGDCKAAGAIRVEGHVEGNVEAGADVVIGKDGVVRGDVSAENAVVSGRIEGNLTISSVLKVGASGRIEGDVDAQQMAMEEGAVINGNLKGMG